MMANDVEISASPYSGGQTSIAPDEKEDMVNRQLGVDLSFFDKQDSCWTSFKKFFRERKGTLLKIRIFLQLTLVDVKARKVFYTISFLSVFLVVLLCVLMVSTLFNLPIVFLRLGESTKGQRDMELSPGGELGDAASLNYSLIEENFPPSDHSRGYHTPRIYWVSTLFNLKGCPGLTNTSSLWDPLTGLPCKDECLTKKCSVPSVRYPLIAIDEEREKRMGFSARWNPPRLQKGEVILSRNAALVANGTVVGDTVILYGTVGKVLAEVFKELPSIQSNPAVIMSLKVVAIVNPEPTKFEATDFIVIDYNSLVKTVAESLSPVLYQDEKDTLYHRDPKWSASIVFFSLDPDIRNDIYKNSDFNFVRRFIVNWVSSIVGPLGFNQIKTETPILMFLQSVRFFSLLMGLIVSIILCAVAFLSLVLIYSLLTVGVETKTYELGIQRMIGFTRESLVVMVLTNAYAFTIPAWIFGLIFGQLTYLALRSVVNKIIGVSLPIFVPLEAVGWATVAGLLLPLFGAFFPILTVISQKLPDALNSTRSHSNAVVYKIIRDRDNRSLNFTMLILGFSFWISSFILYYLFPIGLVRLQLSLLFYIFFGVLFGMLGGLALLALNFERVIQTSMSYLFLFWESSAVFIAVKKSLAAHRLRNRKTTMMYALSLSFIMFVTIAFQIQLTSFQYKTRRDFGAEVILDIKTDVVRLGDIAAYVKHFLKNRVTGMTYVSSNALEFPLAHNVSLMSLGRFRQSGIDELLAIPPNFFEVLDDEFLRVDKHDLISKKYGIGGALYKDGINRVLLPVSAYNKLRLKTTGDNIFIVAARYKLFPYAYLESTHFPVKTTSVLSSAPEVMMTRFLDANADVITSFPTLVRLLGPDYMSVRGLKVARVHFRVPNRRDVQYVAHSIRRFASARLEGGIVRDVESSLEHFKDAERIIGLFLIFTQIMTLVICFFSLFSSMTTNVMESSKEIGVYRCIGMTRCQIYRIFFWEAFIVVLTAGFLGIAIGLVVGYTMQIQNILFTQLTVPFTIPYIQVTVVLVMALGAAILSSYGPVAFLLRLPSITHILRRTS